ncbi:MAG: hypothetical protein J2P33_04335, partial [Actinobacteria bacterium]|nr:hypothetical protein [Actinomycetota bacterium]
DQGAAGPGQATAGPAAGPGPAAAGPAAGEAGSLNLMSVASSAIYKRLIPVVILVLVIIALIIYFAVR